MAIDRETIKSLYKQSESNSSIAKELQIRREAVWKVVKKFRETDQTSNRPGQVRNRTVRTKWMAKNTREKRRTNPRRSAIKLAAEARISQTSMRRILKENLQTFPYKIQKRHELTPTHERMRVERCRHLLSLMEDGLLPNLVFSDEKKFDVKQCVNHQNDHVWGGNASVEGRRVSRRQNPTSYGLGGRHSHWKVSPRFRALRSEIEQPAVHLGHFGRWTVAMGPRALRMSTLDLPAWLGALTWLKNDPTVDSGPHHGVYQQGRLALKEPWPESFVLFGVVYPREQGLPNFSWLSRESEGQIAAGMGLDFPWSSVCLVYAFQGRLKQILKNKRGHIE